MSSIPCNTGNEIPGFSTEIYETVPNRETSTAL